MKPYPSDRAYQLRTAVVGMTIRYGDSMMCAGMATAGDGTLDGKPWRHYRRAARRQFEAIQRLADALRDVEVGAL